MCTISLVPRPWEREETGYKARVPCVPSALSPGPGGGGSLGTRLGYHVQQPLPSSPGLGGGGEPGYKARVPCDK